MSGRTGKETWKVILIMIVAVFAIAAAILGYRAIQIKRASAEAEEVLKAMYKIVPGLESGSEAQSGDGQDPFPAVTINDVDIVGCLEAPSIGLKVPVTSKSEEKAGLATYAGGSPVKGGLTITGDRAGAFRNIEKLEPKEKVSFTDMDGVRYDYRVLTQFHLKNWDEAEYDLMLCYETDDKTMFVVGLKRE